MLKRIAKAFIAFLFGQVLGFAANILIVPLYLHVWSPAQYGEWLTLYSAVAYLSTLDMGVQTYVVNRLTQAYARGDMDEYASVQHTAFAFYAALGAIAGCVVVAVVFFAPVQHWFSFASTTHRVTVIVVALLAFQYLAQLPGTILISVYRTTGNLATSSWLANLMRMLILVFTVLALVLKPSFVTVAAAQASAFVIVLAVTFWHVRRRFPSLVPSFKKARWELVGSILKPSMLFGAIILSTALVLQGASLLVAGALGAAAVALFVTTRTLANSMRQLVNLLANAAWTDLTRLEALDDRRRLSMALRFLVFTSAAGCLAISASLWFEGSSVILFWTRGKLAPDPTLLHWFLIYLALQTPWMTASQIPCATNQHRLTSIAYLVSAITGLSSATLLVRHFGLIGVPMGLIVGESLACYHFVLRDGCRVAGQPYGRFAARLWAGMFLIGAFAATATWGVHHLAVSMTLRWIISGTVSSTVVAVGLWFVWLGSDDRQFVTTKLSLIMRRLKRKQAIPAPATGL